MYSNSTRGPSRATAAVPSDNVFPPKLASGAGKKVSLVSNHFELKPSGKLIYRYDVSVTQTVHDEKRGKREIDWCRNSGDCVLRNERHDLCFTLLKKANEIAEFSSRETVVVYDNSRTLFSCEKLREQLCAKIVIKGDDLPEEFSDDRRLSRGEYVVNIVPVSKNAYTFKGNDLAKAVARNQEDHSLRQFWEILTNQKAIADENYMVCYGTLYDKTPTPDRMRQLQDSCHIVFGISKGTRIIGDDLNSMKAAVVVDSQKAVFYDTSDDKVGLIGNVRALLGKDGNKNCLDEHDKMKIEKQYKDVTLVHLYTKQEFKFSKLSQKKISALTFIRNDQTVSVLDYHRETYGKQGFKPLKPDWFGVVKEYGREGKKAIFPMEVLGIKEGQRVPFAKLSPGQHQALLQEARDPKRRLNEITDALNVLNLVGEGNEYLREHGVRISDKPMNVVSHVRDLPNLQYRDGPQSPRFAKWNSGRFIDPAKIDKFILLFNANSINRTEVQKFEMAYLSECKAKGMNIPKADIRPLKNVEAELKLIMQQQSEAMTKDKKLPFVMLVDDEKSKSHSALKYFEVLNQVLTQQITSQTASKHFLKQTVANIVAKSNQKCFGHNYKIDFKSNFISTSDTLIIGYDVCHPTGASAPARQNGIFETLPSVVGFSFNGAKHPDAFIGGYAFQSARQERVEMLRSYIPWMLELFVKNRGKRPDRIAIIRDGVSEGQFRMVLESEVEDMRKGCTAFSPDYKPKFMVLTVTKRHEKRFFSVGNDGAVRNPTPGTVVDCTVTRPEMTEFFLQPHGVPQGTAKMPAYSLLLNEFGTPPRDNTTNWLVDFLMGLCCSHQIITSAVSIPEPVFQADEWAKRGDANFRYLKSLMDGGAKDLINDFVGHVKDPKNPGDTMVGYKWPAITRYLQYRGKRLQGTRANA